MPAGPSRVPPVAARFSTHQLTEEQRSARWEDWNRGALVGLTCHTPHGEGLRGEEITLDLGDQVLGHVQAGPHRIARTEQTIESSPTHALMVYAILRGRTTFADGNGAQVAPVGSALIVDADHPFRRTFPTGFAELAIKLRGPDAARLAGRSGAVTEFVRTPGLAAQRVRALAGHVARSFCPVDAEDAADLTRVTLDLIDDLTVGAGAGDRLALARLLIGRSLGDPRLSAPALAAALQISDRQLSRLFADERTTFPKYVTERRVRRAAELLGHPSARSISEIAARCGFASPAYFSRVFRDHYDLSPQQYRTGCA